MKKPAPRSLRGKSGKKSGGQFGHRGDTLRQTSTPDFVERHEATHCSACQGALTAEMVKGVEKRQVFDLPAPRLEVTEHQAAVYCCDHCRAMTTAGFPDGVAAHVQYGTRMRAAAVYCNVQQLIPEDRVCQLMRDLFGATSLCVASVTNWTCVFWRIRPPVPTTSGHLFRSIRPPVTRCREASCFGYQS